MQLTVSHPTQPELPIRDVYDSIDSWLSTPELAYASWLSRRKYRASTKEVYTAMFGKFMGWLRNQGIRLIDCETADIERFFKEQKIIKEHRYRYILMIERVFDHLYDLDAILTNNPGRRAAWEKLNDGNNDPAFFLTQDERRLLKTRIAKMGIDMMSNDEMSSEEQWMTLRDVALVSIMFGGGVKVSEVGLLTVSCIEWPDGWIYIPAPAGRRDTHRSRLLPFARDIIAAWQTVRSRLDLPGRALFPAKKNAKNRIAGKPMHRASVFRRTQETLKGLGIIAQAGEIEGRLCAQTLRNSFAAELFDAGHDDGLVAEYLGMVQMVSVHRLRTAYDAQNGRIAHGGFEQQPKPQR